MRPPLSKELWYNRDEKMTDKLMFKQWNGAKRRYIRYLNQYINPQYFNAMNKSHNIIYHS